MIDIRTATEADAVELRAYAIELFRENLPGIFKRPDPTLEEELQFIRSYQEQPNSALFVAVEDGAIVGNLGFVGGTLEEERRTGTFGISVARGHRGRGIGTALLEALLEWAPGAGVRRVQASAWANNPRAIALYERMGFVQEGVCRQAVIRDGQPVDVVMLARLLDG